MLDYKGYVEELVRKSRKAQAVAEGFDQAKVDELLLL